MRLAVIAAILAVTVIAAVTATHEAVLRAGVGFVQTDWSEGPLLLQLRSIAAGGPAYTDPALTNSYDYGPGYLFALSVLRAALSLPAEVEPFRYLSIGIGLTSVIPFALGAVFVARRAGVAAGDVVANVTSALCGAAFGAAIVSHGVTFNRLHPDNLNIAIVAWAMAIYFGIVARRLAPGFVWVIALLGLAAAATKQNTVVLAPILLAGLGASHRISTRLFVAAIAVVTLMVALMVAVMPPAMRAWTVLVPLAHTYEFTEPRIWELVIGSFGTEPYVALSLVAGMAVLPLIAAHEGRTALWADVAALAALGVIALSAYFKIFGTINNLTVLATATVPYAAAAVGASAAGARSKARVSALVFAGALTLGILGAPPQFVVARLNPRNLQRMREFARELCATGRPILITDVLQEFFSCPNVEFALDASLMELVAAYPRYAAGLTVFDRVPAARYIVSATEPTLPQAWAPYYRPLLLPVMAGGPSEHPLHVDAYERK